MAACRRIGESRRGRHVFKYRTGGNSAHRTGSSCQSLLPAHHPTDSTVATDYFTLSIAFIIGIIVAHNAASILACSLIVAVAVILHNVLGLALGYGLSSQPEASHPNDQPLPSRWACKIQAWPLHWPPLILPCFPWRPYPEPCSRYGTTFRQHCGTDFQKTGR